jgi:8-oxo-dGTP diphosphatase
MPSDSIVGLGARLHPLALWFWKVLPLPTRLRRAYIELTHPRFLVGVMALIRDDQDRVLILEHTYRRRHRWGLPGGYLQAREEPTEGLTRELGEETGLTIQVDDLLAAGLYTPYQLDLLYRARIVGGQFRQTPEISGWRFVEESELVAILPNQLSMLARAGVLASFSLETARLGVPQVNRTATSD